VVRELPPKNGRTSQYIVISASALREGFVECYFFVLNVFYFAVLTRSLVFLVVDCAALALGVFAVSTQSDIFAVVNCAVVALGVFFALLFQRTV